MHLIYFNGVKFIVLDFLKSFNFSNNQTTHLHTHITCDVRTCNFHIIAIENLDFATFALIKNFLQEINVNFYNYCHFYGKGVCEWNYDYWTKVRKKHFTINCNHNQSSVTKGSSTQLGTWEIPSHATKCHLPWYL